LRKLPTRLRGTNFCTSSACFASSFVRQQNGPECTQIVRNAPKREFRVNRVDQVRLLQKIPTRLHGTNFCTSSVRFAPSFVRQQNGPECTQIVQNTPKRQFRVQWVDRVRSLRKILTRLCGTNFCTSSARFASSFVRQLNGPECSQIVRNVPKR
jgi:TorA maturation chaperone TorD